MIILEHLIYNNNVKVMLIKNAKNCLYYIISTILHFIQEIAVDI